MFQRRVLTLSSLVVISFLAVALLPVVIIATLAMSTLPKFRTTPQAMTFIYGFLLREWAGLTLFIWVLLRYPKVATWKKIAPSNFGGRKVCLT